MTHTEKVHVLFGLVAVLTGGLALVGTYRPNGYARKAWPVLAFLIGLCLFIPVEAQTRTYQVTGWWETFRSVIPQSPATWVTDWVRYLPQRHVIQHKIGAVAIMAVGLVEWLRARGRLMGAPVRWALPALLIAIALAFGVHGGTAVHLSHRSEQIHHLVLGVAFAAGGVSLALVRAGLLRARPWDALWALLVLGLGLDIALFYRLSPLERVTGVHHHESADTRLR
jgi:hypothetical protein